MLQKIINKLNDLRPKQLMILAGIAAVLMFVAIYAGMSMMAGKEVVVNPVEPPPQEEKVIETKAVVVAKVNIPARTRIQESMLQIKEVPVDIVPEGVITSFDDVKDVQVKVSIFAGDVLTIQKLFADKSEEGFVGAIPADCRAVSINVNEVTGVAGFAKPGDKVDLLLVEKSNYSATTNVLLQNVPLLSVNQDMSGTSIFDDGMTTYAISNPTIATFALPPEDVLKLISASKLGEIYMMLRPANPRANYIAEMEYTIDSINKPKPAPEPTPVIPANPVPDLPQIPAVPMMPVAPKFDIIQGDELTQTSEETAQIQNFSKASANSANSSSSANSALPAIPSRNSNTEFTDSFLHNVPLSSSPIANQIGH